jgi:hypothetical protein
VVYVTASLRALSEIVSEAGFDTHLIKPASVERITDLLAGLPGSGD